MSDVKLGILLWSQGATWKEMLDAARRVDRLGYAHLWTWDHLYAIFGDPYQPIFEGWSLLNAWARETEQTRLGLLVGANTFRNPGIVAKTAATLDHVSDGRAILGIGGAWMERGAHGPRHRIRDRLRPASRLARRVGRARCGACSMASRSPPSPVGTTSSTTCATTRRRSRSGCRS